LDEGLPRGAKAGGDTNATRHAPEEDLCCGGQTPGLYVSRLNAHRAEVRLIDDPAQQVEVGMNSSLRRIHHMNTNGGAERW